MDMDLTLDEIIEQKREHNPPRSNGKNLHVNHVQMKPRKWINKTNQPGQHQRPYDARNKIIQKTRAKIVDARDILNQNRRDSGIDARNMLIERKKERMAMPLPLPPQQSSRSQPRVTTIGGGAAAGGAIIHKGRFGQRTITMSNRGDELVATPWWDPKDQIGSHGGYKSNSCASEMMGRLNASAKPFVPRGYVDYDNMQQLEDEEISRTMHLSNQPVSGLGRSYVGYDVDMDGVDITLPPSNTMDNDPFSIYETSRNRLERPSMPPPSHVSRGDNLDKRFERRQRNLVTTSKLPESLRARLFGAQPDRRVSHGIYANENGTVSSKAHMSGQASMSSMSMHQRRSPPSMSMPLPLSVANNKPGYRLLVSNLHTNVTTSDIRELFNDIGPMYDARVVRPGTAEVIYKSLEHAEMAVDAYHQREFDGQPMHCVLVNPHSSNRVTRSVSSRTVTTNSSGVEVDIDALHSVLFRDR
ncbi:uncharacterized protein LOC6565358 [Drosophila grimshawi]|uniref:GH12198 n=1 Tax=Drosophila grimshawi TaxID=7222 RepID=B4JJR7_DROGR|nr:uncharacterized protein LOC6565358 [Drosophila grimshawi]EDV99819.1 GH12198 [Drosophila grimshawi]